MQHAVVLSVNMMTVVTDFELRNMLNVEVFFEICIGVDEVQGHEQCVAEFWMTPRQWMLSDDLEL
jgi:hypothetical protein